MTKLNEWDNLHYHNPNFIKEAVIKYYHIMYRIYENQKTQSIFQLSHMSNRLNSLLNTSIEHQTTYSSVLGFILLLSISLLCK